MSVLFDSELTETERQIEALLFAASGPLSVADLARRLPEGADIEGALAALQARYEARGVELVCVHVHHFRHYGRGRQPWQPRPEQTQQLAKTRILQKSALNRLVPNSRLLPRAPGNSRRRWKGRQTVRRIDRRPAAHAAQPIPCERAGWSIGWGRPRT